MAQNYPDDVRKVSGRYSSPELEIFNINTLNAILEGSDGEGGGGIDGGGDVED